MFDEVAGGVTPATLARAYEPRFEGVAQPDGYLSRHGGDEPLIGRDGPDGLLAQAPPAEALAFSAGSEGLDRDDIAMGSGSDSLWRRRARPLSPPRPGSDGALVKTGAGKRAARLGGPLRV